MFNGKDKSYFCRRLYYDKKGNVTANEIWGNLTGNNTTPLIVDKNGIPNKNGCEVHRKTATYSQDGWNLLLTENEGAKTVLFGYYPGSNLLKQRFTCANDAIVKREFFAYDDNSVLIEEIVDDGIADGKEDLTGVTQRTFKRITPTVKPFIGLPEIIEEGYVDNNSYYLLKKVVNKYSKPGKIIEQTHYGSDGQHAYTLYWTYDPHGNLKTEIDAQGSLTEYTYDANDNKITEQNPVCSKKFTYDFANRLIQTDEIWPNGQIFTTKQEYNTLSQCIALMDHHGNKTTYGYDAFGRQVKTTFPAIYNQENQLVSPTETKAYDEMGNIISTTDANGNITKIDSTIRGQPYCIQYPDGTIERKEYSLDGLLKKEISKTGLITNYEHDALGRVIRTEISDPAQNGIALKTKIPTYNAFNLLSEVDESGLVTTYTYDKAGRRSSMRKGDSLTEYLYDTLGRAEQTIEWINATEKKVTFKKHDNLDRVIEERIEDQNGLVLMKEEYSYDHNGNRTEIIAYTKAGIAVSRTTFDPNNQPVLYIDPLGNETTFAYDYNFDYRKQKVLKITRTDALGNQEIKIHDTHGKVSCQMHQNKEGKVTQKEEHFYDALGNKTLTKATVYGSETSRTILTEWKYDKMSNVTQIFEAKGTSDQKETFFYYNAFGQKETTLTPNRTTLYHHYNSLGLLKRLYDSGKTVDYTMEYDLKDHPIQVYDAILNQTTTRSYDLHGLLQRETLSNGYTLSYTYDDLDRLLSVTLPDQSSINYIYNSHYLTTINRKKNNTTFYQHQYLDYDLAENVGNEQLIGQAGKISYDYDLLQRTIATHAPKWQELIPTNGYDSVGNLLKRQVSDSKGNLEYSYAYDDLYQLTSENGAFSHTYQNDSLQNRIKKDTDSYDINDLNQLRKQADCTYKYDKNGNLTEKKQNNSLVTYSYDALDRLVKVNDGNNKTSYTYDSFHRRTSKTVNGKTTYFLYDSQNEIGAVENGVITQLRLLGITRGAEIGASVAFELQGKAYAPIHDPYGNIVTLLDLSGALAESYRYTAFGEIQSANNFIENPWRYSSKRFDPETGFIYFGRRYYSPDIGRWVTPDPAGFVDGLNLYAYVHNRPLTYIDPDGRFIMFLAPMAISWGLSYIAPAAALYVAEVSGCIAVAAFFEGVAQGYNNSYFEPSVFGELDGKATGANWAGKALGTALSVGPKSILNLGGKAVMYAAGTQMFKTGGEKLVTAVTKSKVVAKQIFTKQTTSQLAKGGTEAVKQNSSHRISQLEEKISGWLGEETKLMKNKAGDTVLLSKDGMRRARFDFLRPNPHNNPHMHLEELIKNEWKGPRIYPIDVPHN